jgi:hypothetical protein
MGLEERLRYAPEIGIERHAALAEQEAFGNRAKWTCQ